MGTFFLLYALTISIELLLSLVMAIFLYLIVAPPGGNIAHPVPNPPVVRRPLARTVEGALGEAFTSVSERRDDVATITNARSLLARYARERREGLPRSG